MAQTLVAAMPRCFDPVQPRPPFSSRAVAEPAGVRCGGSRQSLTSAPLHPHGRYQKPPSNLEWWAYPPQGRLSPRSTSSNKTDTCACADLLRSGHPLVLIPLLSLSPPELAPAALIASSTTLPLPSADRQVRAL